jgi:hypothetical protein
VLIVIGVGTGLVYGVWAASVWGLRKTRRDRAQLLLVGLTSTPVLCIWGAELFGWPTPASIAVSVGAATGFADRRLLAVIEFVTAVVVLVALGRSRVTRRWRRGRADPSDPTRAPARRTR